MSIRNSKQTVQVGRSSTDDRDSVRVVVFVFPLGGIGVAKAFSVASTCSSFEVLVDGSAVTVLRFEGGIDTAGADVGGRGLTVGFL